MPRKYDVQYIDRLLEGSNYHDLVELSSAMCAPPTFTGAASNYGLPRFAFVFVETLKWFAQSIRSEVWTYYESTPQARQEAMAVALREIAPKGFALWYERGMHHWRNKTKIAALDDWIEGSDEAANDWLRLLLRTNRESLLELT